MTAACFSNPPGMCWWNGLKRRANVKPNLCEAKLSIKLPIPFGTACLSSSGSALLSNQCSAARSTLSFIFSCSIISLFSCIFTVHLLARLCSKIVIWSPSVAYPNLLQGHCLFLHFGGPSAGQPLTSEAVEINGPCVYSCKRKKYLARSWYDTAGRAFTSVIKSRRDVLQAITVTFP